MDDALGEVKLVPGFANNERASTLRDMGSTFKWVQKELVLPED